jgi:hypothetical protein
MILSIAGPSALGMAGPMIELAFGSAPRIDLIERIRGRLVRRRRAGEYPRRPTPLS